jgi:hypothetical protein
MAFPFRAIAIIKHTHFINRENQLNSITNMETELNNTEPDSTAKQNQK